MKLGAFGGLLGSLIRLPRIVSERLRAPQQHDMHAQNGRGAEETPPGKEGWWPGSARAGTFVRVRFRTLLVEGFPLVTGEGRPPTTTTRNRTHAQEHARAFTQTEAQGNGGCLRTPLANGKRRPADGKEEQPPATWI